MKNVKFIIIVAAIIFFMVIGYKSVNTKGMSYKVLDVGYMDGMESRVIATYTDYLGLLEELDEDDKKEIENKYDKEYFNKNSLAFAYKDCHPDDTIMEVNFLIMGDHLNVMAVAQRTESATDVISGVAVLVEVDKTVTEVSIY